MPRRKRTDSNGRATTDTPPPGGPTAELTSYVDRLEALFTQKADAQDMIAEVLKQAEDNGFHKKALQATVRRRLETADQKVGREAFEDSLDQMLSRLGMLRDTPLGEAAAAVLGQVRH
jgi:uncharacterized protein (UPF0335 family)